MYSWLSQDELEGMFVGLMAYLKPKQVEGTIACQKTGGRVQYRERRAGKTRTIW